jgi:hypothetical protein
VVHEVGFVAVSSSVGRLRRVRPALTYDIDLDAVLAEVHPANMTKMGVFACKAVKGPGHLRSWAWFSARRPRLR